MHFLHVHWPAVIVSAIAIFILGGLWYSKALFATKWIALMGITEEQMKAKPSAPMPVLLLQALICSFLISLVLAVIINHFPPYHPLHGALAGSEHDFGDGTKGQAGPPISASRGRLAGPPVLEFRPESVSSNQRRTPWSAARAW